MHTFFKCDSVVLLVVWLFFLFSPNGIGLYRCAFISTGLFLNRTFVSASASHGCGWCKKRQRVYFGGRAFFFLLSTAPEMWSRLNYFASKQGLTIVWAAKVPFTKWFTANHGNLTWRNILWQKNYTSWKCNFRFSCRKYQDNFIQVFMCSPLKSRKSIHIKSYSNVWTM